MSSTRFECRKVVKTLKRRQFVTALFIRPLEHLADYFRGAPGGLVARVTQRSERCTADDGVAERQRHFLSGGPQKLCSNHGRIARDPRARSRMSGGRLEDVPCAGSERDRQMGGGI